jgi:hydroxyacylglutathione hydrolase
MLFRQFHVPGLAQQSYALGCGRAKAIAVVDPERDPGPYLEFARAECVRITHVLETHIHADFASGAAELARLAGAELCLSAYDQGEAHRVAAPHRRLLEDDTIEIGPVLIRVLHTPGHTPEHVSFLVHDRDRSADVPVLLLSGDFLFAGSVGRPDLQGDEESRELARMLARSIARLRNLPDGLAVYPAHGAGSLCGSGAIGGGATTLGFERIANPFLSRDLGESELIDLVLDGLLPSPEHFQRLRTLNCSGPRGLAHGDIEPVDPAEFQRLTFAGHLVLDVRSATDFGDSHVPGALGLGVGPLFLTWAGWVVPSETPLLLVGTEEEVTAARTGLARVGLDDVRGRLDGGMEAWSDDGLLDSSLPQVPPKEAYLRHERGEVGILDVRNEEERRRSRIEGAVHVPGWEVEARAQELADAPRPWSLICRTGYASTLAASLLMKAGLEVLHVPGGMEAWTGAGLPVTA